MPNWTKAQTSVIETRNKNILVSAAAGSGKTAVLVERIIQRLLDENDLVDIDKLLVVTFTNAAASEMRERILKAIEKELEINPHNEHLQKQQTYIHNANITTIHSFCLGIIKENFSKLDIDPGVKVADENDIAIMKTTVIKQLLEDYYEAGEKEFKDFIESYSSKSSDENIEKMILSLYNKSMGYPWPKDWLNWCLDLYRITKEDDLNNTLQIKFILNYGNGVVRDSIEKYEYALNVCDEPGGPAPYKPNIEDELAQLKRILGEKEYERRYSLLNMEFERLKPCKKTEVEQELKDIVKNIRDGVKGAIKKLKSDLYFQNSKSVLRHFQEIYPKMEMYIKLTIEFIDRFKKAKLEKNIIDFNDFEHYAIDILVENNGGIVTPTKVADELAKNFVEVMVDEYQDSNIVQETILNSISGERFGKKNRFMVGDVKQSIYGFRGANPDIFIEKYNTYTTSKEKLEQKIILDKNFRSREEVINSTNYLFSQIMQKDLGEINYDEENKLYLGADYEKDSNNFHETEVILINSEGGKENTNEEGNNQEIVNDDLDKDYDNESEADDDVSPSSELEAKAIAFKIKELVSEENGLLIFDKELNKQRLATYKDIVILLRSTSTMAEVINDQLMKYGIPCYMESRTGYFNTIEIRTLLSYLKIIDNPRQDIDLATILKSPMVNLEDNEMGLLRSIGGKNVDLYDNILWVIEKKASIEMPEETFNKIDSFYRQLNMFRDKSMYMSIYNLISEILLETGYEDYIKAMPSGNRRYANVTMLKDRASLYESGIYKGLFNFVKYIEKINKFNIDSGEASVVSDSDNAVRIMTIHKSKGLEFPIVFLANIGKGFNFMDGRDRSIIHRTFGIGTDNINVFKRTKEKNIIKSAISKKIELETIEEEMRLLYVACTRAKEKLIFTANGVNEKKILKYLDTSYNDHEYMGFGYLSQCKSYLDFIGGVLGRNKAFDSIRENFGREKPYENKFYQDNSYINVLYFTTQDIMDKMVKKEYAENSNTVALMNITEDISNKNLRKEIKNKLDFKYKYSNQINTAAKISVSDIKKISYEEDSTIPNINSETHLNLSNTVPEFLMEGKKLNGALRGTAYHRVFELFDFSINPTQDNIKNMFDKWVENKIISQEEMDCINISHIVNFANSSLGKRMKKAYESGNLYREAQFVLGLYESEIEYFKNLAKNASEILEAGKSITQLVECGIIKSIENIEKTGEIILIQGIIDVYFIEDNEIVIADYKTDNVTEINQLVNHYFVQLELYKRAVEQINNIKVKEKIIYSVKFSKEIEL